MPSFNNILISLGTSLITGFFVGESNKVYKYYSVENNKPKREISKVKYENSWKADLIVESKFNTTKAVSYGILTLGVCIILTGIAEKVQRRKNK